MSKEIKTNNVVEIFSKRKLVEIIDTPIKERLSKLVSGVVVEIPKKPVKRKLRKEDNV